MKKESTEKLYGPFVASERLNVILKLAFNHEGLFYNKENDIENISFGERLTPNEKNDLYEAFFNDVNWYFIDEYMTTPSYELYKNTINHLFVSAYIPQGTEYYLDIKNRKIFSPIIEIGNINKFGESETMEQILSPFIEKYVSKDKCCAGWFIDKYDLKPFHPFEISKYDTLRYGIIGFTDGKEYIAIDEYSFNKFNNTNFANLLIPSGNIDVNDGKKNVDVLLNNQYYLQNHDIFPCLNELCKRREFYKNRYEKMGHDIFTGEYIPSRNELEKVMRNMDIISGVMMYFGKFTLFPSITYPYWMNNKEISHIVTSTEVDNNNIYAWSLRLNKIREYPKYQKAYNLFVVRGTLQE